ncbi:GPI-GlcNAc transferase complex, PIG-H component-domain-containing protein [Xylaria castorea]|nr:GPI-GlcNAc transferase complex, PIG-H component-domain-containing protein [Xylaria castorea]
MLTTSPYLRIRRPSPTAAEFTVSTLPPLTVPLRLSLYAIYLSQGLLSGLILLFLYATWAQSPYGSSSSSPATTTSSSPTTLSIQQRLLHAVLASPVVGVLVTTLILPPRFAVPACLLALYALTRRLHVEESLLVLRGLGIQTSSSKDSLLAGRATTRFIPTEKILDVMINEAFHGFGVRYYLVVVVEGEPDVVVVFPRLLPRADVVERVWRGVRECLYERKVGNGTRLDGKG